MSVTRRGFMKSLTGIAAMFAGAAGAQELGKPGKPEPVQGLKQGHSADNPAECGTCLRFRAKYVRNPTPENRHALDRSIDYHTKDEEEK